jgi:hypothetical protein
MKSTKPILAAACAFAFAAGAHAQPVTTPAGAPPPELPHDMRCWPSSGNPDQDFALRVYHHHAMEAQMAQYELDHGTDATLRAMAQAIVNAHDAERASLESWFTAHNVVYTEPMMWRGPGPYPWRWEAIDVNNDGRISKSEVVATWPLHDRFDTIDANDDGFATREEIDTFLAQERNSPGGIHDDHRANAPMGPCLGQHEEMEADRDVHDKGPPPSFRSMDSNGDGFLARDEIPAGNMLLGHFTEADTNNDGRLSAGEVDAHNAAMAQMGKSSQ